MLINSIYVNEDIRRLFSNFSSHTCILTMYSDIYLHISYISENINGKYIFFLLHFQSYYYIFNSIIYSIIYIEQ